MASLILVGTGAKAGLALTAALFHVINHSLLKSLLSFADSYAVAGGVSAVIPVDLHIKGCPPAPAAPLTGLLALFEHVALHKATAAGCPQPLIGTIEFFA